VNRFEAASALTLIYEGNGRISRDPDDPGGVTKYGIAQRWHPDVDVENLTRAQAVDILRAEYWVPIQAAELPWPLAAVLFDHAVHSGAGDAAEALQRTVGAKPDQIVGPKTLAAAMSAWKNRRWETLDAVVAGRIQELVDEAKPKYLAGWMRRCANLALWAGRELERENLWSGREPMPNG
jgi:lysozyme family protein